MLIPDRLSLRQHCYTMINVEIGWEMNGVVVVVEEGSVAAVVFGFVDGVDDGIVGTVGAVNVKCLIAGEFVVAVIEYDLNDLVFAVVEDDLCDVMVAVVVVEYGDGDDCTCYLLINWIRECCEFRSQYLICWCFVLQNSYHLRFQDKSRQNEIHLAWYWLPLLSVLPLVPLLDHCKCVL